jgi:hypothetical protein
MEQTAHEVKFIANPTQKAFILSRAEADLFCSRMGEGKSAGLAWACWHHTRHNPGAIWALVRDTWENNRRTTQQEFFRWFAPGVFGTYKATEKCFYWRAEGMTGQVYFLGLDEPEDASKLQSLTLAGFGFDEPAPALDTGGIDEAIFDVAMTRLRQPGMNWYAAKLAQNNPDETHWTYRRFVDPGAPVFVAWQTRDPENMRNLPEKYYDKMRANLAHRPDLWRRFGEGKYGFQAIGVKVTPEWSDDRHLASGLKPIKGRELILLWDFGQHPACALTQMSPLRHWNILEAYCMEGQGVYELIELVVRPVLTQDYDGYTWQHTGDPTGSSPEQSSRRTSAVKVIQRELGGIWTPGPTSIRERVDPLRAILRESSGDGIAVVQVDRDKAKPVWHALRGGWHRHVARTGVVSQDPVKDIHSHPGDIMGYGAAKLFPLGKLRERKMHKRAQVARFFGRPGVKVPKEAMIIGAK